MLKVGITGGMGSGKTVICRVFKIMGIPVFSSDDIAKELLNDAQVIEFYRKTLGNDIIVDKKIDRKKTAAILFNDSSLIKQINSYIHPLVEKEFEKWCENFSNSPYVLKESAILFENNLHLSLDYNILVIAPIYLRLQWLVEKRNLSLPEIEKRMAHQWPDEKKMLLANFTIINDNKQAILPQIDFIHNQLLQNL
jgi:dephospho-CoA kinase